MTSIIIVNYHVGARLLECIKSIFKSKIKTEIEIIVVDNDEIKTLNKKLHTAYPQVKYIANKNKGFGQGNNVGARVAKGKYLFFLNPDTKVYPKCIDQLVDYLDKNKKTGIVAPLLYDKRGKPYSLQGHSELNPKTAIFSLSFINKLFPNNWISKKFWLKDWKKKIVRKVDVVPGTAFVIRKEIFEKIKGFDERFFLFFEEADLCKRVLRSGFDIVIYPQAKVYHYWGASTSKSNLNIQEIFNKSRFYYFKKHFGIISALLVSGFLGINKQNILLLGILVIGFFLLLYKISELMPFIGDQGWYYLSARDMLLTGNVPLVGITSSHLWLHQGALWTYMLAPFLLVFNYNPISGAYLTAVLGLVSIFLVYKIGIEFFSTRFALISSLIYATSPLVVFHLRMPYHTSPIPLFVLLLFYSFAKWIRGDVYYFPLVLFSMSILYNLELSTVVFWPVIIFYIILGIYRKSEYSVNLLSKKILSLSLFALIVPMIPMIIYDMQNGFQQTIVFAGWIIYKILQNVGIISKSGAGGNSITETFDFFITKYELLIIMFGKYIAFLLFSITIITNFLKIRKENLTSPISIFFLLTLVGVISFFVSNVPSEAYLVMLFPGLIILFVNSILQIKKTFLVFTIVIFIVLFNISTLISTNYLMKDNINIKKKISAVKEIRKISGDRDYNLIYKGIGEEFQSSIMPYEYLMWWIYRSENVSSESLKKIVVIEKKDEIIVIVE